MVGLLTKNKLLTVLIRKHVEDNDPNHQEEVFSELPPMDGKHAWMIAAGTALISVPVSFAYLWGLIQDYYEKNETFVTEPDVNMRLTTVGILNQSIGLTFCFFASILYSIMPRKRLILLGTVLISGGFVSAAYATSIWHLYLSLGLCSGSGAAIMQSVCVRTIPEWFQKQIGLAFGIQFAVTAVGGLTFPYMVVMINNNLGIAWTMKILGLIFFVTCTCGLAIIKHRIPPKTTVKQGFKQATDFRVFKNKLFLLFFFTGPIQLIGQYIVLNLLPLYATAIGLSGYHAAATISTMAGIGLLGKLLAGLVSDKIGPVNTYMIYTSVCSISVLFVWMFAYNFVVLMMFAILMGFFFYSYPVIAPPVTLAIVGFDLYPAASTVRGLGFSVALVGPVLSSYMENSNQNGYYFYSKLFCGLVYALAGIMCLIIKLQMTNKFFVKV
ncbi:major facilitator superfamily domain-containing protein [Circinella umbellata]|nr:major facilitator superfamily domain-containing protein [Circinella umbellata]